MALYLGSDKVKLTLDNIIYHLNLFTSSSQPIFNGIILKSSDEYILKDSNGIYLTAKEAE